MHEMNEMNYSAENLKIYEIKFSSETFLTRSSLGYCGMSYVGWTILVGGQECNFIKMKMYEKGALCPVALWVKVSVRDTYV